MKILVTGGASFIGSAFVRMAIGESDLRVVNLDKVDVRGESREPGERQTATRAVPLRARNDICDAELVNALVGDERPDAIVHFAAESHVDRSILSPEAGRWVRTNTQRHLHATGSRSTAEDRLLRARLGG